MVDTKDIFILINKVVNEAYQQGLADAQSKDKVNTLIETMLGNIWQLACDKCRWQAFLTGDPSIKLSDLEQIIEHVKQRSFRGAEE